MPDENGAILDLIRKCGASREARRASYGTRRLWMLRGTDRAGPPARFNKIRAHIKTLTSYLYAPEGTRFALKVPAQDRKDYLDHLAMGRDAFVDVWRDGGADVAFEQYVTWALVYSSSIAKVLPDPAFGVTPSWVFPGDFGVLREDVPDLDRQEAFVHWYSLSMGEVKQLVRGLSEEKQAKILLWAEQQATPGVSGSGALPQLLQQVIVTNTSGDFFGSGRKGSLDLGAQGLDSPENEEPLVECAEVWELRDFKTPSGTVYRDYWVSTVIGDWPIIERRNPVLPYIDQPLGPPIPAENPFAPVIPNPLLDYFWGSSELTPLVALQQWRESRMNQIDRVFELGMDPPLFFSGVAMPDDKIAAMRKPGGYASTPQPGAKMEPIRPELPTEAFQIISQIDGMFADSAGMQGVLEGKEQAGVRAGNQLGTMAGIAAGGRIRDQALLIEDALEVLATRMFHLLQRRDQTAYPLPDGKAFLLAQLPQPVSVRVSAHSASPVYAEQTLAKAQLLKQANAIGLVDFIDLIDPPHRADLMEKGAILEEQQAQQAKAVFDLKVKEVENKGKPKS
jgi:hypothetical protein